VGYGPNGFVREFRSKLRADARSLVEIEVRYDVADMALEIIATNAGPNEVDLTIHANAHRAEGPWLVRVPSRGRMSRRWSLVASHCWYDFTVSSADLQRRFAGRIDNGEDGFSDPAI